MITVACVYWKGEFRGRENIFKPDWVEKLKNMVSRNLDREHRFVCLSNVDVPAERIPLEWNLPGFWSKIELFRPGLFEDRVLYLDLDVIVTQSLMPLVLYPSEFVIMKAPGPYRYKKEGKSMVPKYNSSVMVWDAGVTDSLYEEFDPTVMNTLYGDQDYIATKMPKLDTFPQQWVQKFRHLPRGKPRPSTRVVLCMPGYQSKKNTTLAQKYKWVKEIWQ